MTTIAPPGIDRTVDLSKLTDRVRLADFVKARAQRVVDTSNGRRAICIAYIQRSAVEQILDETMGPFWSWELLKAPEWINGGWQAHGRLTLLLPDGTEIHRDAFGVNSDSDPNTGGKGAESGALKRAGFSLGIGRALGYLEDGWAATEVRKGKDVAVEADLTRIENAWKEKLRRGAPSRSSAPVAGTPQAPAPAPPPRASDTPPPPPPSPSDEAAADAAWADAARGETPNPHQGEPQPLSPIFGETGDGDKDERWVALAERVGEVVAEAIYKEAGARTQSALAWGSVWPKIGPLVLHFETTGEVGMGAAA